MEDETKIQEKPKIKIPRYKSNTLFFSAWCELEGIMEFVAHSAKPEKSAKVMKEMEALWEKFNTSATKKLDSDKYNSKEEIRLLCDEVAKLRSSAMQLKFEFAEVTEVDSPKAISPYHNPEEVLKNLDSKKYEDLLEVDESEKIPDVINDVQSDKEIINTEKDPIVIPNWCLDIPYSMDSMMIRAPNTVKIY